MFERRFKGLVGAKGKHPRIVDKVAIYDETGNQLDCCEVKTDDAGREYYCPSNKHDKFGLFTDKPKDAIECIRNGFGDSIWASGLFSGIKVVRYIDREHGEEIRNKTLEGWKNSKFAYGVKFYYLNSFSDGRLVLKNKKLMSYCDDPKDILYFDSKEDAASFIEEVNEKATKYCDEYDSLERTEDSNWDYENTFEPFFNSIEGRIEHGKDSVYWSNFYGLCRERETGKRERKMEVVELVKKQ